MENLKKLLNIECSYRLKDETMESFMSLMTEFELERNKPLIPYGEIDNNIYIVKEGIIRLAYFDGFKEKTLAFGLSGTVLISYNAFCHSNPSFMKCETCCNSVIMKVPKAKFLELANKSHDFAQWMMHMSMEQLFNNEVRLEIVNGSAKERLESLMEGRPEIVENVYNKVLASYIGIAPEYLCRLKQQFKHKLKNQDNH
jgi:CRP-like cAMP-binding protein